MFNAFDSPFFCSRVPRIYNIKPDIKNIKLNKKLTRKYDSRIVDHFPGFATQQKPFSFCCGCNPDTLPHGFKTGEKKKKRVVPHLYDRNIHHIIRQQKSAGREHTTQRSVFCVWVASHHNAEKSSYTSSDLRKISMSRAFTMCLSFILAFKQCKTFLALNRKAMNVRKLLLFL